MGFQLKIQMNKFKKVPTEKIIYALKNRLFYCDLAFIPTKKNVIFGLPSPLKNNFTNQVHVRKF